MRLSASVAHNDFIWSCMVCCANGFWSRSLYIVTDYTPQSGCSVRYGGSSLRDNYFTLSVSAAFILIPNCCFCTTNLSRCFPTSVDSSWCFYGSVSKNTIVYTPYKRLHKSRDLESHMRVLCFIANPCECPSALFYLAIPIAYLLLT
jgi:hypothetical protein